MARKKETFARINTRVTKEQFDFIKSKSKELKVGEGELHRQIIQFYIAKMSPKEK